MLQKYYKKFKDPRFSLGGLVVAAVIFAGVHLLTNSFADSPSASVAASTGTLTSPACLQSDASATNGNDVEFGCAAPSWNCTENYPADGGQASCPYAADTTNFVGMNNPYNTAGGKSPSLGTFVNQNVWSPVTGQTQTLQANSGSLWQITANIPNTSNGAITNYPNLGSYAYTGVLDDYSSLTYNYNVTMPIGGVGGTNTNSVSWATQDDWLSEPSRADGEFNYEVQVHVDLSDHSGGHNCGPTWIPGSNFGIVATNQNIGGQLYAVCNGQAIKNSDGTCVNGFCGEIVLSLGGTASNTPQLTTTSGSVDLMGIFQWLETHDVPGQSYPYMEAGSALSALSQGWEMVSTNGTSETFTNNSFSYSASGAPKPPTSAPTGVGIATGTGHTCVVHWNAVAGATAGYDMWSGVSGFVRSAPGTTSYTVTGTSGQVVGMEVAASNSGGNGPYSGFTNNCTIP